MPEALKTCSKCKDPKPASAFSKNRQNPDGLAYYCRTCNAAKQKEWKHANPILANLYRGRLK